MVRYFFAWVPLFIVMGTASLLTIPYLALIVLAAVPLVVLAACAWAIYAAVSTVVSMFRHPSAHTARPLAEPVVHISTGGVNR